MIEIVYKFILILILWLILTYLVLLNIKNDKIIKQNHEINYNVAVIAEQLKIDNIIIE